MTRAAIVLGVVLAALAGATAGFADLVAVRFPEGPAHGFLVLSDANGTVLAHGELLQWLERRVIVSQLVIRFDDGSLYDETVRFSQRPVFRVASYRLVQRGPSFTEFSDITFDRAGRYRVRRRATPDAAMESAVGRTDLPDDVSNGMVSVLLKNVMPAGSLTTHVVTFRPNPRVLELHLTPEGTDRFTVGPATRLATRFLVQPKVGGVTGVLATWAGKQPPLLRRAPTLVRFDGPLYADGPAWRIELGAPEWSG